MALVMMFSVCFSMPITGFAADSDNMKLTVLATSDMHGTITSWSYEGGTDTKDRGLVRVKTAVDSVRKENPNTVLIDNGDTIQGTILTDDLYNKDLSVKNPMIEVMGYIGYDAMTLGNHEFNFGLETVEKIKKEAKFPILAANIYNKKDGSNFTTPYVIKNVNGVKVGILGLTVPTVRTWDASKVTSLEFKHMAEEAKKYVQIMKNKEKADVIIISAHAGLESRHEEDGSDMAKMVAEACPEATVMITGHDHSVVNQTVNGVLVAAPTTGAVDMVRVDVELTKVNGEWTVKEKKANLISLKKLEADAGTMKVAEPSHLRTLEFLKTIIGRASGEFHQDAEIPGIPEAQIRDTAVMDLINEVQLSTTKADVAAAALFKSDSNLPYGNLTYANVFDIYKYPNTLVGVEVTGAQLKKYMEWSASYYNMARFDDLTISFNPDIRSYNYDVFAGVTYKVDISKAAGSRIVDLKRNDKPVQDTDIIKLAINNYRYDGLKSMGILKAENKVFFNSDPSTLRSYIKDYIEKKKVIDPVVDNNWSVIGLDQSSILREAAVLLVKTGKITIPKSKDGRTDNVEALSLNKLQSQGYLPTGKYLVSGDTLESVANLYRTTPERLLQFNKLAKKSDFKPGITIYPPTEFLFPELKKIDILTLNDFHGNLVGAGSDPGAAKLAAYMEYYKKMNPEGTVILNAGDAFQGTPMSNLLFGKPVVDMMNTIGFDAMTMGNHEFDWSAEKAVETMKSAKFPLIVANIYENGKPVAWAQPTTMLEKNGIKIGIVGLATQETSEAAHKKYVGKLEFKDPSKTAQTYADQLKRQGANVVIALGHLPAMTKDNYNYGELLETAYETTGIDAFVGGHSHMNLQGFINGKPYVEAYKNGRNVGHITLYLDATGKVVYSTTELIEVSKGKLEVTPNAAIAESVKKAEAELAPIFDVLVGKAKSDLKVKKNEEMALGNFTADAMRATAGTDVCFTNEGGIRADIPAGNITVGTIFKVSPFDNTIAKSSMTGEQIKALLELSAKSKVGYLQVSGLKYTFDSTKPEGSRILSVTMANGKALDLKKTYTVATNDFLAPGGDGFTVFKEVKFTDTFLLVRDAMINAIKKQGTIDPKEDGRMIDVSKKTSFLELLMKIAA